MTRHVALAPQSTRRILDMIRLRLPFDMIAGVCRVSEAHVADMAARYGADAVVFSVVVSGAVAAAIRRQSGDGPGAAERWISDLLTHEMEAKHAR